MTWKTNTEKLLCHLVLSDTVAQKIIPGAAEAYWRCFIVQDRATGVITGKMRFKQRDGTNNWQYLTAKDQGSVEATVEYMRCGFEDVFRTALTTLGISPEGAFEAFYPPDDEGEPLRTIAWLQERDLVHPKRRRQ